VTFTNSIAEHGGAVSAAQSSITFATDFLLIFVNNTGKGHGGAIYLSDNFRVTFSDDSDVIFTNNTAFGYGGAVYSEISDGFESKLILSNTTEIHFYNNTGFVGELIYVQIQSSCND